MQDRAGVGQDISVRCDIQCAGLRAQSRRDIHKAVFQGTVQNTHALDECLFTVPARPSIQMKNRDRWFGFRLLSHIYAARCGHSASGQGLTTLVGDYALYL